MMGVEIPGLVVSPQTPGIELQVRQADAGHSPLGQRTWIESVYAAPLPAVKCHVEMNIVANAYGIDHRFLRDEVSIEVIVAEFQELLIGFVKASENC